MCVKNGGVYFLVEIVLREFMESMVLLFKVVGLVVVNVDVCVKIFEFI